MIHNLWQSGDSALTLNLKLGQIEGIHAAGDMLILDTTKGITVIAPGDMERLASANLKGAKAMRLLTRHIWYDEASNVPDPDEVPDPPDAA